MATKREGLIPRMMKTEKHGMICVSVMDLVIGLPLTYLLPTMKPSNLLNPNLTLLFICRFNYVCGCAGALNDSCSAEAFISDFIHWKFITGPTQLL